MELTTLEYARPGVRVGRSMVPTAVVSAVVSAGIVWAAIVLSRGYVDGMIGWCGTQRGTSEAMLDTFVGPMVLVPLVSWWLCRGGRLALRIAQAAALGSLAAVVPALAIVHGLADWYVRR